MAVHRASPGLSTRPLTSFLFQENKENYSILWDSLICLALCPTPG